MILALDPQSAFQHFGDSGSGFGSSKREILTHLVVHSAFTVTRIIPCRLTDSKGADDDDDAVSPTSRVVSACKKGNTDFLRPPSSVNPTAVRDPRGFLQSDTSVDKVGRLFCQYCRYWIL